jgi:hypothetical protein
LGVVEFALGSGRDGVLRFFGRGLGKRAGLGGFLVCVRRRRRGPPLCGLLANRFFGYGLLVGGLLLWDVCRGLDHGGLLLLGNDRGSSGW